MTPQEKFAKRIKERESRMLRAFLASKPGAGEIEVTSHYHSYGEGLRVHYTEGGEPKVWQYDSDIGTFVYEHSMSSITSMYEEWKAIIDGN